MTAKLRRHRWFVLTVILPVLLTAVYYGLIASDQYVSESRFVIKAPAQKPAQVSTLANLIQTTGLSAGQEQASELMDYIGSRSALADLDRMGSVEAMFARPGADVLSRYPAPWHAAARENLYRYYRQKVEVGRDHDSGLVVLRVTAFAAHDAQALNARLLALSERLVNDLNARAGQRAIAEAQTRVREAEARAARARSAMAAFRDASRVIAPGKQAEGILGVSNALVSERAALTAQVDLMERVTPANPSLPSMRSRLAALSREIAAQDGRAVGGQGALSGKLAPYEGLLSEQEFAAQMLTAAHAALEQARTEAAKQQFYLERVVDPSLPDLPELPHRLRIVLSVLGAAVCLYLVGWMFIVGILEHSPED